MQVRKTPGRSLSLRTRLLLLVLLGFLPVVGFLLYTRGQLAELAWEEAEGEILRSARVLASGHRDVIQETRVILAVLAQTPEVRQSVDGACIDHLPRIFQSQPYYTLLGAIDRQGYLVCTAPPTPGPTYLGDREYMREAYRTGEFVVGEYQVGRVTGRPSVSLVYPVFQDNGRITHLLAAGIDLDRVTLAGLDASTGENITVTVFDREGVVLARVPDGREWIGRPLPAGLRASSVGARQDSVVGRQQDLDGNERIFAVAPLRAYPDAPDVQAFVAVGFDPAVAGSSYRNLLTSNLFGLLFSALFSALLIWVAMERYVLQRLSRVAEAARRLGEGDWEARVEERGPSDEVGGLALSFNAMARSLQKLREAETRWARGEIQEREERLRQLAESIDSAFWLEDLATSSTLYVSPAMEQIWGRPAADFLGTNPAWAESIHPDDRTEALEALAKDPRESREVEYRIVRPDQSIRWIRHRSLPVQDEDGEVTRLAGLAEDITEERRLREDLRHSQRMEAVGRLAGGVAHDFNNILTAIIGQVQLLLEDADEDDPSRGDLGEVLRSAQRAATLTAQLLAFSRKQMIQPRLLDLSQVVGEMEAMLRAAVGEPIRLVMARSAHLPPILADPGQMEQILLNLAVNARDAMPGGGTLTVNTEAVDLDEIRRNADGPVTIPPGSYVQLTVTDTGVGMEPDVMEHIFEPFYTTKEMGKGTGLGLATVYGIVKQNQGFIWVESEPNQGTTLTIHLPVAPDDSPTMEEVPVQDAGGVRPHQPGGTERILLVEDEDGVRAVAQRVLARAGYTVGGAASAQEARDLLREWEGEGHAPHLLLTDVVMPDTTGPELVAEVRVRYPSLPILYMSGYAEQFLARTQMVEAGAPFLHKPFPPHRLLAMVRSVLDSARGPAGPPARPEAGPS
ncbi:MAG: ATP-binding protein [Gemmatimonadota bacterium]